MDKKTPKSITIYTHDLPKALAHGLGNEKVLWVDTETDGLVVRRDKLRLVQVMDSDDNIYLIRNPDWKSKNLKRGLTNPRTVFHYSLFDLTFLSYWMNIIPSWSGCTKILSKIASPNQPSSLSKALQRELDITIGKNKQITTSNWNVPELSDDQIEYACEDILYLPELEASLFSKLNDELRAVYRAACNAVYNKVELEVQGYTDLTQYESDPNTIALRNQWLAHKAEMEKV